MTHKYKAGDYVRFKLERSMIYKIVHTDGYMGPRRTQPIYTVKYANEFVVHKRFLRESEDDWLFEYEIEGKLNRLELLVVPLKV